MAEQDGPGSDVAYGRAEPARLSILMTNIVMAGRTGTEIATGELAQHLRGRGHRVAIYAPTLGPGAAEWMARGIPVTDRIDRIGFVPDVIHGSHNVALAAALVRFAQTPAVLICHDSSSWFDAPILCGQVAGYVAVDAACVERLVVAGADERRIVVIPNGIDIERFRLRARWAARPARALAITKHQAPYLDCIRQTCRDAGLALEVVGPGVGRTVDSLPALAAEADIVFAASRGAMEAAATGAAVVMCDERGFGGLLNAHEVEAWPDTLLSRRQWRGPVTADALRGAIASYSAEDAADCARRLRARVGLDRIATEYEAAYRSALGAIVDTTDRAGLAAFVAAMLPGFGVESEHRRDREAARRRDLELERWLSSHAMTDGATELAFGKDGVGAFLLQAGWHEAEAWGVWSRDHVAHIRLPRALLRRWGGELSVACFHYMPAGSAAEATREVEVLVDGEPLDVWRFARADFLNLGAHPRFLRLPPERLSGVGFVSVTFRMHAVQSPLEAREAPDPRWLGLGLRTACAGRREVT